MKIRDGRSHLRGLVATLSNEAVGREVAQIVGFRSQLQACVREQIREQHRKKFTLTGKMIEEFASQASWVIDFNLEDCVTTLVNDSELRDEVLTVLADFIIRCANTFFAQPTEINNIEVALDYFRRITGGVDFSGQSKSEEQEGSLVAGWSETKPPQPIAVDDERVNRVHRMIVKVSTQSRSKFYNASIHGRDGRRYVIATIKPGVISRRRWKFMNGVLVIMRPFDDKDEVVTSSSTDLVLVKQDDANEPVTYNLYGVPRKYNVELWTKPRKDISWEFIGELIREGGAECRN